MHIGDSEKLTLDQLFEFEEKYGVSVGNGGMGSVLGDSELDPVSEENCRNVSEPSKQATSSRGLRLGAFQRMLQTSQASQYTLREEVEWQLQTSKQLRESLAGEIQLFHLMLTMDPARGRWGVESLRWLVESVHMEAHCSFAKREGLSSENLPDLIVHLPSGSVLLVDAKVPLPDPDFFDVLDDAQTPAREQVLLANAEKLTKAIDALAARDYPKNFPNALHYPILFLAADFLFRAAVEAEKDLVTRAASKKVLLSTPASLSALLRAVRVSWQSHAESESERYIASAEQELFHRVRIFSSYFDGIDQPQESSPRS